tara:strand:- start:2338 stop:3639 length:1302 start_codon:yes stop_codon:yes gene_type:complete
MVAPLILATGRVVIPKALKYANKLYSAYYTGQAVKEAKQGDYTSLTGIASSALLPKVKPIGQKLTNVIITSKGMGMDPVAITKHGIFRRKVADKIAYSKRSKNLGAKNTEDFTYNISTRKTRFKGFVAQTGGKGTKTVKARIMNPQTGKRETGTITVVDDPNPAKQKPLSMEIGRYKKIDYKLPSGPTKYKIRYRDKTQADTDQEIQQMEKAAKSIVNKMKRSRDDYKRVLFANTPEDKLMASLIRTEAGKQGVRIYTQSVKGPINKQRLRRLALKQKGTSGEVYKEESFGTKESPINTDTYDLFGKSIIKKSASHHKLLRTAKQKEVITAATTSKAGYKNKKDFKDVFIIRGRGEENRSATNLSTTGFLKRHVKNINTAATKNWEGMKGFKGRKPTDIRVSEFPKYKDAKKIVNEKSFVTSVKGYRSKDRVR